MFGVLFARAVICSLLIATIVGAAGASSSSKSTSSSYDYVIVGGGTSGTVLARRLSEDAHFSVALIEAGGSQLDNPAVEAIYGDCLACASPVDWNYTTVAQVYMNNQTKLYHSGRCLGGTSAINGMVYLRPSAAEIDAWATLGNEGWTWDSLLPYFRKSEHFQIPPASQEVQGATYIPDVHGFKGPVDVGFSPNLDADGWANTLKATIQEKGLHWNADPNSGYPQGIFLHPSEFNLALGGVREDANRAYLEPVTNRSNLHVFTYTTARKIDLTGNTTYSKHGVVAKGVEVVTASGENKTIYARREIILSTGTYRTPALLEMSGIGNPSVLSGLDVPVKVSLPGVGSHMQDQYLGTLIYNTTTPANISEALTDAPTYGFVTASDVFGSNLTAVAASVRAKIPAYAQKIADASGGALSVAGEEKLLRVRLDLIFDKNVPIAELLFAPGFIGYWPTIPLSKGSVHANPADSSKPLIDPNFYALDFDLDLTIAVGKFARNLYTTAPPISSTIIEELVPGIAALPVDASAEAWRAYLALAGSLVYHGCGTAPMLARELGGVVDCRARVYGVKGLRIVDASILPGEVNGHPTSVLYAAAEKIADMIKSDWA